MKPSTEPAPKGGTKKPRLALFIATGFGLGYLPLAPGTWGSLGGLVLAICFFRYLQFGDPLALVHGERAIYLPYLFVALFLGLLVALIGVWSSNQAHKFSGAKDPQFVVIDEVSGQVITLLVGAGETPLQRTHIYDIWVAPWHGLLNWKYLVLGLILFRVFDIWKPFPVRQAERLPGGWGIMADDWLAGIYAALGLWLARALGL